MDGYEAAKEILKNNPSSKIIALTGTTSPDEVEKIIQAGMLGYLQKPFTEWSLFQAISKIFPFSSNEKISKRNPPVNLEDLKKMTGDDHAFFNEMLKIFIRSSETGLTSIHDNFNKADWEAVSGAAHKLAAPSKHLNASTLYNDLKKLESEAMNQRDISEIKKLIASIEDEILQVNTYLKSILSED
jgi:HPt (histidine-containing phosphotransfer) domain-containing protein